MKTIITSEQAFAEAKEAEATYLTLKADPKAKEKEVNEAEKEWQEAMTLANELQEKEQKEASLLAKVLYLQRT